jgi:DNA excision repair protein ERCC-6
VLGVSDKFAVLQIMIQCHAAVIAFSASITIMSSSSLLCLELAGAVQVLAKWHQQGHKALFFTQTQQMLDIMERHVNDAELKYHRMDGSVPLQTRFRMIDDFNNNPDIFLFLLTTRVGGLGVNLTGADRILLFDPDWNPATDIQARERAWRLGQKRPVTIFRHAPHASCL